MSIFILAESDRELDNGILSNGARRSINNGIAVAADCRIQLQQEGEAIGITPQAHFRALLRSIYRAKDYMKRAIAIAAGYRDAENPLNVEYMDRAIPLAQFWIDRLEHKQNLLSKILIERGILDCHSCGNNVDNEHTIHDQYVLCPACFNNTYCRCNNCQAIGRQYHMHLTRSGLYYCYDCRHYAPYSCANCTNEIEQDKEVIVNGEAFCGHCLRDKIEQCIDCQTALREYARQYMPNDSLPRCTNCHNEQ